MWREPHALNLHSSGVAPLDPSGWPIPAVDPWLAPRRFEAALGRWLGVPADEVLFTPGATGGTLLALLALADRDAPLVVERPIYEPMLRQAERLGPVVRLERPPGSGWRFDLAEAEARVAPGTGLVLITEPHNPSGVFSPREDVLALAELAARRGATLLVNEVYRGFSDRPSYHGLHDRLVVVGSLSKLLGAYTARLGWLSGRPETIARLRTAQLHMTMAASPDAAVGLAVLERADALAAEARARGAAGRAVVDRWVGARGLRWRPPEGPGFGCIELAAGADDLALAERLHDEHGVLVVPGRLWEAPGTLRLSWLQATPEELAAGLERLGAVLA